MYRAIAFIIAATIAVTVSLTIQAAETNRFTEYTNQTIVDTIEQADSVTGIKLGDRKSNEQPPAKLSSEQISSLQALLLDDSHYIFDMKKKCMFVPQYSYTFKQQENSVTVVVSELCQKIKIIADNLVVFIDDDPMATALNTFNNNVF